MEFFHRVLKAHKNGSNVSTSKNRLNVSYTLVVGFGKINIPLLGAQKIALDQQGKCFLFSIPLNFLGSTCNQVSSSNKSK